MLCSRFAAAGMACRRLGAPALSSLSLSRRFQASGSAGPMMEISESGSAGGSAAVPYDTVWALWNEGNLFSLSAAQMQAFLKEAGVPVEADAKKAAVVRRVEEYLHAKDASSAGSAASPPHREGASYGRWGSGLQQPETLLDLAQAGFYEGAGSMVPKAFQLLPTGSCSEAVVNRVNTTAFPGFPANAECYTLTPSDATGALQTRYSKVLQWSLLNMNNLRMDGELALDIGKLLLQPRAVVDGEAVVSTYTMQQRLQLSHPYTWVSAVPESSCAPARAFLTEKEGFAMVSAKSAPLTYEGIIKRAKDQVRVELDDQGMLVALHADWVDVQSVFCTAQSGPDIRALLRSRPPTNAAEREALARSPIIELSADDVSDVLPPEQGQLVYLAECETRRYERLNDCGIAISVLEVRRQPLIVLRDEEEDPRLEYSIVVHIPASAGRQSLDVRSVGLEVLELAQRFAQELLPSFNEGFDCAPDTSSPSSS